MHTLDLEEVEQENRLPFPANFDGSDLEIHADGGDVVSGEGVVGESHQQRALAHSGIADDEQFEQMVVILASVVVRPAQRHPPPHPNPPFKERL